MTEQVKTDDIPEEEPLQEAVEHDFEFSPISYHEWRQEGTMIICSSCPFPHSASVKQGLILTKNAAATFALVSVEEEARMRENP